MMARARFRDRREAGRVLAAQLRGVDFGADAVLLALPRGGVPVATEISERLQLPLEVFLVRKLGLPRHPEFAMGAIASGGVELLDETLIARDALSRAEVTAVIRREELELRRREQLYRPAGGFDPGAQPAVIVDDGLATGFSMRAAVAALRRMHCPRITVAVPVGARSTCAAITRTVEQLVCPLQPDDLVAVGLWYEDFSPTDDDEVLACLARTRRAGEGMGAGSREGRR
jgi:predicted phosphoribosyltransferase